MERKREAGEKNTIGSQKATQYRLEELCVSSTRKSGFTKNICLPRQEGRQTVRGSPLGLRQGGGGPSSKVNGHKFQVSELLEFTHMDGLDMVGLR